MHKAQKLLGLGALPGVLIAWGLIAASADGALVYTVGALAPTRSDWVAAGPESLTVEDLNSQTSFTGQTTTNVASGTGGYPWVPSGGGTLTWDLGPESITTTYKNSNTSYLDLAVNLNSSQSYKMWGTNGKWGWLSLEPNSGPVSAFGVDFSTSFLNDRSGVGYFSWHVYFSDGTYRTGRLRGAADAVPVAYDDVVVSSVSNGFFGIRDDSGPNIERVEFFSFSNGSNIQIDNITFGSAVAVPEPSLIGCVGLAALGFAVAFRGRKKQHPFCKSGFSEVGHLASMVR